VTADGIRAAERANAMEIGVPDANLFASFVSSL
jgi:hypothetical protein